MAYKSGADGVTKSGKTNVRRVISAISIPESISSGKNRTRKYIAKVF
jgi:hypothetical protein